MADQSDLKAQLEQTREALQPLVWQQHVLRNSMKGTVSTPRPVSQNSRPAETAASEPATSSN